jgi:hypothetical protein
MNVVEATETVLAEMGFTRPGPFTNDGLPELPQDPTVLSDEEVSCLYFAYVGWLAFAESERWVTATELKTLETKLNRRRAETLAAEGKGTVTARKAQAALDPMVRDLEERALAADILRDALDDVCQRCERAKDAMSREMSRRGSGSARSSRWNS